ncbi:ABC transporter six-transmembrane domain-containing protein [Priestia aryabhattai]|uniref:ABC transporter six-transmembrane domain-containing protein n=1 Tax=Priestia TaxID=2800373 RepID=UPI00203DB2BA|nr:ABC transporter six-transmembrane domain-containing protein [Priestia aryabhattai]MCM2979054.1 ABC transporter six-transmembrane domain-containing protein [Priestia aryabhattai]
MQMIKKKENSVGHLLQGIWSKNRKGISFTYMLTIVENICDLLYAATTGFAIDGLLKGNPSSLIPLSLLWILHLGVGLFRHVYDTKVFVGIYSNVAVQMVERQRADGVKGTRIVGRVSLSREVVDFFQRELPAVATTVIRFLGAIIMLFIYDSFIGLLSLLAMIPILVINHWFGRRSYRLNHTLNNRIEEEADIVVHRPLTIVQKHFTRLRLWRIAISNAEAKTWGMMEIVVILLTLTALLRLTGVEGTTAGSIYAVLAYIWMFQEAVIALPEIVQNISRVLDIGNRVAEDVNN